jgi:hypothetical protein
MTGLKRTAAAMLTAAVLTIAGCSALPGGGAGSDEPAGVVNAAIAAAESGGFAKLADYSCAANKDDLAKAFSGGGGDLGDLTSAGVDMQEIFAAMKVDFQDAAVTETSKTDTDATVHIKGKIAISFDEAKMREIVKKIIAAQGITATDQMVDLAMQTMSSQLSKGQDIDSDLKLIKEDGKWVVCN